MKLNERSCPRWGRLSLAAAAAVIGLFAWGDVVISDNVALSSTLTLNVPAGEMWTYSGVIPCSFGIVKNGGGTLRLTGANTFNEEFAVVHFEDGGKIDVPAGVVQKFAERWVDGVKLPPNRYTASNLPAHVSGAGAITIAGQGMMILFR